LRLAARLADGVNVMGDAAVVRRKVEVLHAHAAAVARDPATIEVTHLAPTVVGDDREHLADLVERLRPRRVTAARFAAQSGAGTIVDQVDRFHELAGAGVSQAIVSLGDLGADPDALVEPIERFGRVIEACGVSVRGS
jgi:alkanesulfonate monooxygenase SsuD/methylene tetrahydromethanopterin reductase-like flavin-dependent oxidoreductase (luciferase family)